MNMDMDLDDHMGRIASQGLFSQLAGKLHKNDDGHLRGSDSHRFTFSTGNKDGSYYDCDCENP